MSHYVMINIPADEEEFRGLPSRVRADGQLRLVALIYQLLVVAYDIFKNNSNMFQLHVSNPKEPICFQIVSSEKMNVKGTWIRSNVCNSRLMMMVMMTN